MRREQKVNIALSAAHLALLVVLVVQISRLQYRVEHYDEQRTASMRELEEEVAPDE